VCLNEDRSLSTLLKGRQPFFFHRLRDIIKGRFGPRQKVGYCSQQTSTRVMRIELAFMHMFTRQTFTESAKPAELYFVRFEVAVDQHSKPVD
jgi:hypothetical protein